MGSNNSAKLDDPVATALGSDTDSELLGYFQTSAFADSSINCLLTTFG